MGKPWNAIDWEADHPSLQDVSASRQRIEFQQTDVTSPAALHLVEVFRSFFHDGGAHIASFQVSGVDEIAHWFFSRNRFEEYGFVAALLTSDAMASSLPDITPVDTEMVEAAFKESNALLFDGQIAEALVWGGPYANFDGSMADAKRLGVEVCNELIGERFQDFRLDNSHEPWSKWFKGVAWDFSWILIDRRDERVTLICITDTD